MEALLAQPKNVSRANSVGPGSKTGRHEWKNAKSFWLSGKKTNEVVKASATATIKMGPGSKQ